MSAPATEPTDPSADVAAAAARAATMAAMPVLTLPILPDTPRDSDTVSILHSKGSKLQQAVTRERKGASLYERVSQGILIVTYALVIAVACLMTWYLAKNGGEPTLFIWSISGFFVCLTVPLTLHDIHMHCKHYVSPLQRHYVRILFMVPIYSIQSWLALRFQEERVYLETLRDLYEAFVIYAFYSLMLEFLGGKKKLADRLLAKPKERAHHLPPLCCLRGWRMGSRFVHRATIGVYQYVFLRVIMSIASLIALPTGAYHEGSWNPKYVNVYATVIINVSQMWALYCLALFYIETRDDLKPLSPLGKFSVVKAVVFFSWWQGVAIAGLASMKYIHASYGYNEEEISAALQDFIICIEMLAAAIAHKVFYPVTDFVAADGSLTPLALMRRAEAEFDAAHTGHTAIATARSDAPLNEMEEAPAGMSIALRDVMPTDIIVETAEHLRSGFGLVHKWEKRREEAAAAQEKIQEWNAKGTARSTRKSRFNHGGEGAASEEVDEPDAGGSAGSSPERVASGTATTGRPPAGSPPAVTDVAAAPNRTVPRK